MIVLAACASAIIVTGHSEGSLLGMLATQRGQADAFVSIAGAGRPAAQVIHEQLATRAPAALVAEADRVMEELSHGRTNANPPPSLGALFRPSVQPYLISWFRYDPSAEIRKLRVPVLILQGTAQLRSYTDPTLPVAPQLIEAISALARGTRLCKRGGDCSVLAWAARDPTDRFASGARAGTVMALD
ncbi:MAG: hypothetical protein NVS4B3_12770 [Gemmatimonadaceae bacterium]